MNAMCPAMADVGGVRYAVSTSYDLVDIQDDLRPYASISRTNSAGSFADESVFAVAGIDPTVLLVALNLQAPGQDGEYRLLQTLHGDREAAYPALCAYLPDKLRMVTDACTPITP